VIATKAQAAAFLANAGIALRYGPHKTLPISSVYAAVARRGEADADVQRRATELTNALIGDGTAIEILCVADRVAIAHASLVPALIALRRRGRTHADLELSDDARRVLAFVASEPRATAGQVRAHLGVPPRTFPNRADDALAELQRWLVLDRGPTDVPEHGPAYLTKEGIPYRLVDEAHPAHVRAAAKLSVARAAKLVIARFPDATPKPLLKLLGLLLSADELAAALPRRG
jgi:hypothetical protein